VRDFSSRPRTRPATHLQRVLVALAAGVFLFSAWSAHGAWQDERRVRARLDQARQESQAASARAQAFDARVDPSLVLASQALLTADAPPGRVVSELSMLMPGEVRLESLRLVYGSRLQLEMRVAARDAPAYDAFLDRLERSPSFTEVLPGDENREGELQATVRAYWRGGGA
jgi:hypothetical protein